MVWIVKTSPSLILASVGIAVARPAAAATTAAVVNFMIVVGVFDVKFLGGGCDEVFVVVLLVFEDV